MRLEDPLGYRSMHSHRADHAEQQLSTEDSRSPIADHASSIGGTRKIVTNFGDGAVRMEASSPPPLVMSPSQNNLLQMFKQFDRQFDQPHHDDDHERNDEILPAPSSSAGGKEREMKT